MVCEMLCKTDGLSSGIRMRRKTWISDGPVSPPHLAESGVRIQGARPPDPRLLLQAALLDVTRCVTATRHRRCGDLRLRWYCLRATFSRDVMTGCSVPVAP